MNVSKFVSEKYIIGKNIDDERVSYRISSGTYQMSPRIGRFVMYV